MPGKEIITASDSCCVGLCLQQQTGECCAGWLAGRQTGGEGKRLSYLAPYKSSSDVKTKATYDALREGLEREKYQI